MKLFTSKKEKLNIVTYEKLKVKVLDRGGCKFSPTRTELLNKKIIHIETSGLYL